jgi:hypothetical protein
MSSPKLRRRPARDSESSSDEPTNTEVETRKIDDPHINTHSSVAIRSNPIGRISQLIERLYFLSVTMTSSALDP